MKNIRAVKHSVLAFFVNPPGEGRTKGGIITLDDDGKDTGIKTRFFEIHDVGHDNIVTNDISKGDIVVIANRYILYRSLNNFWLSNSITRSSRLMCERNNISVKTTAGD